MKVAVALPKDVAAGIDRAYRTLKSYQDGTRAVTLESAQGLSRYLRQRGKAMLRAADALDTAITREEKRHG